MKTFEEVKSEILLKSANIKGHVTAIAALNSATNLIQLLNALVANINLFLTYNVINERYLQDEFGDVAEMCMVYFTFERQNTAANTTCVLFGDAILNASNGNVYAYGRSQVRGNGNANVYAYENAQVVGSFNSCSLQDNAIGTDINALNIVGYRQSKYISYDTRPANAQLYGQSQWVTLPEHTIKRIIRCDDSGIDTGVRCYNNTSTQVYFLLEFVGIAELMGVQVTNGAVNNIQAISDNVYLVAVGGYTHTNKAGTVVMINSCVVEKKEEQLTLKPGVRNEYYNIRSTFQANTQCVIPSTTAVLNSQLVELAVPLMFSERVLIQTSTVSLGVLAPSLLFRNFFIKEINDISVVFKSTMYITTILPGSYSYGWSLVCRAADRWNNISTYTSSPSWQPQLNVSNVIYIGSLNVTSVNSKTIKIKWVSGNNYGVVVKVSQSTGTLPDNWQSLQWGSFNGVSACRYSASGEVLWEGLVRNNSYIVEVWAYSGNVIGGMEAFYIKTPFA